MKIIPPKTDSKLEYPKPIITKGRGLTKLCFAYYGVKRIFLESDKKLRRRTIIKLQEITRENKK